jgi:Zn-dependent protease with chaperone function
MVEAPVPSSARLLLLLLEGYLHLALVLGVFVAAVALLAWGIVGRRPFVALASVFVGIPLLVVTAAAIRALFFRIPQPDGVPVAPEAAPALHRLVDDLRRRIGAPRVHRVIVGEAFNASAVQLGRFGILFPRNVLLIGYPLFATLSADHLRAVIAHELGHLSRAHGRLSVMVYRLRQSWIRVMQTIGRHGWTPAHMTLLFRWFGPRLHVHATAVGRRQELLADRLSAQLAGARVTAETLVALGAAGTFVENAYWDDVGARADDEPEPPAPFTAMSPVLWERYGSEMERVVAELLEDDTGHGDTHPSLRDRLASLGEPARLPPAPAQTAAEILLGAKAPVIAEALDARWREQQGERWTRQHASHQTRRRRLSELEALVDPTAAQLFERGQLVEELDGDEAALPHYAAALERGSMAASLTIGRLRLERDDESGVGLIERAMDDDPVLVREGCGVLARFFERRGQPIVAHRYGTRATRHATREQFASSERDQVTAMDRFASHGLSAAQLASLLDRIGRETEISRAMLVSRELRYSAGAQLVLALVPREMAPPGIAERMRNDPSLPASAAVIVLSRRDEALTSALAATPGSEVYRRRG